MTPPDRHLPAAIPRRHDASTRRPALAPYLAALGISHLYASPIFAAAPGSTHGYDVTDFNEIDPALGGMEGFDALSAALQAARPRAHPRLRAQPHGREPLQSVVARRPRMGRRTATTAIISTSTGRRRSCSCRRLASPTARRCRRPLLGLAFDRARRRHLLHLLRAAPAADAALLRAHPRPRIDAEPLRRAGAALRRRRGRRTAAQLEAASLRRSPQDPASRRADRRGASRRSPPTRRRCTRCTRRRSGALPIGGRRARG